MTYGLQLFNGFGTKVFDSGDAAGGVCLGIYSVPGGGATYTFPNYVGRTGIAVAAQPGALQFTTDNALGYLRFVFTGSVPQTAVLFVK